MEKESIQSLESMFSSLQAELVRRKFLFNQQQDGCTLAYNQNFKSRPERILFWVDPGIQINVSIGRCGVLLDEKKKNAVMEKYMEHFDVGERNELIMRIRQDAGAFRDMSDVANILTRAYSIAVTAE